MTHDELRAIMFRYQWDWQIIASLTGHKRTMVSQWLNGHRPIPIAIGRLITLATLPGMLKSVRQMGWLSDL
jgi:hypothetical protein